MSRGRTVRIYVLGTRPDLLDLIVMAEYGESRALNRPAIHSDVLPDVLPQLNSDLSSLRSKIAGPSRRVTETDLQTFGQSLHRIMLAGPIQRLVDQARGKASGQIVHLHIYVESPTMTQMPWELLCDHDGRFIALRDHPVARGLFTLTGFSNHRSCGPPLIVLGASPGDAEANVDAELDAIKEQFYAHSGVPADVVFPKDLSELEQDLSREKYGFLHYFGHAGFDPVARKGYLQFDAGGEPRVVYADQFAAKLFSSKIQLVCLSGCKTARGAPAGDLSQTAVATAVHDAGVPAVIGSQFDLPDSGAHFFAAKLYQALLRGDTIGDAARAARDTLRSANGETGRVFDWIIPALFTVDPQRKFSPSRAPLEPRLTRSNDVIGIVLETEVSVAVDATVHVVVLNLDTRIPGLADHIVLANQVQSYIGFALGYRPVAVESLSNSASGNIYVPLARQVLSMQAKELGVDQVVCLTTRRLATDESDDFFSAVFPPGDVSVVSACDVGELAEKAQITLAKTVFRLVLSAVLSGSPFGLTPHESTMGCPLDYCDDRTDIVLGLKRSRFDHAQCRAQITDPAALAAIDRLMRI